MPNPATGYSPLDMFGPLAELFQGTLPQSPTQGDDPEAFLSAPQQSPVTDPTMDVGVAAASPPAGTNPTDNLRTMIMQRLLERLEEPAPDVGMGAFWKRGLTGIREQNNQYAVRQQGANTMLGVLNNIDREEHNQDLYDRFRDASARGWAGLGLSGERLALSKRKFALQEQGFDSFEKEEYNQQTGRNEVFLYSMRRDPQSGKMEVIGKEPTGIAAYGLQPPMEVPGQGVVQLPNKPTSSAPAPSPVHPAPTQTGQPASAPPPNAPSVPQQTEANATSAKPAAPEAQLDLGDTTSSAATAHKTSTNQSVVKQPPKKPRSPEEIEAEAAKIVAEIWGAGQSMKTSAADPARPGGPAHSTLPIGTRILGIFKQPPGGVGANAAERRAMMSGLKGDILDLQSRAHELNQQYGTGKYLGLPGEVLQNKLAQSQDWRRLVPDEARGALMAYDQAISWLLYQYVKAQTGAQFSYLEFQRYAKQFPTALDTPEDARMLIEGAITNVNRGLVELQRQWGGLVSPNYRPEEDDAMPPQVQRLLETLSDEP